MVPALNILTIGADNCKDLGMLRYPVFSFESGWISTIIGSGTLKKDKLNLKGYAFVCVFSLSGGREYLQDFITE